MGPGLGGAEGWRAIERVQAAVESRDRGGDRSFVPFRSGHGRSSLWARIAHRFDGIDDVEYDTMEWVDRLHHGRLLEPTGHVSPAEFEAAYYRRGGPQLHPRTQGTEPAVNPERSEWF